MHGHRDPSLYRETNLARPVPSLSSAESFPSSCFIHPSGARGGNEPRTQNKGREAHRIAFLALETWQESAIVIHWPRPQEARA
jgi:hypothetical protein